MADLFAWTATYLPFCRPLTAYCRVICKESLQPYLDIPRPYGLGELETSCIGLVLGETATYVAGISNINRLNMASFTGTYSFAMTRAISINMLPDHMEKVGDSWYKARHLTGQKSLSLTLDELNEAWKILGDISEHRSLKVWNTKGNNDIMATVCH